MSGSTPVVTWIATAINPHAPAQWTTNVATTSMGCLTCCGLVRRRLGCDSGAPGSLVGRQLPSALELRMPDPSPAHAPHLRGGVSRVGRGFLRWLRHEPIRARSGRVVVPLFGEITSRNVERVGRELLEVLRSRPGVLEIDLSRVTYFSSDGGAVFFMVLRAARESGTRVATHVGRQPLSALRQLGLERVCELYAGPGPDSGHAGMQ
ncbi:STAS domain-containing protein [Streptomyces sp. NPDC048275]|uniref:STAS domain-containing protein n=1 Tax=Streptomyces sp. NPDC048275 TaxID=3155629 RepID=UPI0033DD3315